MALQSMISRRSFLCGLGALVVPNFVHASDFFLFEGVIARARKLANRPYQQRISVPKDWLDLTYDEYKKFWFRTSDALWSKSKRPFVVDFFHPGLYFPRPVRINTVIDNVVEPFKFNFDLFDKTDTAPSLSIADSLGYSGFRLRTEFDQPGIKEEFCVFQGASYFRAIGQGQVYGLSARGLALKTGDPTGEEFPEFIEFWLKAPTFQQSNFFLYALLDSQSVSGAYKFEITPGQTCHIDVTATLFPREKLSHIGIAPLTSMFLFDETNRNRFDDFRTAVHDSDGLGIYNGAGEMIWRPLANPKKLQISAFLDNNPRGFGLMQRARKQSNFADLEAHYHRRPSLWIEPKSDWGRGTISLVEIPTEKEIYDNIVAYWRPAASISAGHKLDLSYRMTWGEQSPIDIDLPRVINTRLGKSVFNSGFIVAIDFESHPIFNDDLDLISIHIQSNQAETTKGILQRNPETGGVRLGFRFVPKRAPLAELRAQLRKNDAMASEVWLYRWTA
ncbi:MAG: glucan biosynthesis protein G [Aestuariivita sp.]|nr:glucan biosynthesis protein G [Aestuariivita sp.]